MISPDATIGQHPEEQPPRHVLLDPDTTSSGEDEVVPHAEQEE